MDRTFDNLPYQIPGPAGGISYPTYSQEQRGELNKSDASRIFRQPSWRALLHLLRAPPFGASRLQSSVALLRSHALSDRFQRVSRLAVLVDALSWVGRDASVKLRDPTGVIRATIHAEVFDKWKTGIEHGAALLLDGVAAVAYVERRPKGFRTDAGEALHVSIQLCHVVKVFPVGNSFLGDAADVVVKEPRESYAPAAIAPPVVRRPPSRRPAAPPPPPRVPLRPRQEHHGNRSMRRPNSAGGYAPYRGGFKGHPQQPRQPMPNANYRSPNGYQQNKRPYSPHDTGSPPGVRRPGMQPLPKRPALQRPPGRINLPIVSPATPVNSLTDDQLDDLLGDIDVDAVIAASGKAKVLAMPVATVSKQQSGAALDKSGSSEKEGKDSSSRDHAVAPTSVDLDGSNTGSNVGQKSALTSTSKATPSPGSNNASKSVPGSDTNVGSNASEAGQRSLSFVDEAMIDNLLEGLDSSDFG